MTENPPDAADAAANLPAQLDDIVQGSSSLDMWLDPDLRDNAWKAATRMASSSLVPVAYRNKPADCMIAMEMADMLQVRTIAILQNVFIVHGMPTFRTTFIVTLANQRGPFAHPIRYRVEGEGESLKVTAWSTLRDTGEIVGAFASMEMARKEKWDKNQKYDSMPEQMLHYRSASLLINRYCPEVRFGFNLSEEVEDVIASGASFGGSPRRKTGGPAPTAGQATTISDLNQKITGDEAEDAVVEQPVVVAAPVVAAPMPEPETPAPSDTPNEGPEDNDPF